ncbi:MAG TPA: hypothetical protein VGV09_04960 [Steroidobacteraceae bacterium]|nr:hypothetical protein [Steroidobacteraceae bacterium]
MPLRHWYARGTVHAGAPGVRAVTVTREEWRRVAADVAGAGGRLLSLWAGSAGHDGRPVHAVFLGGGGGLVVKLPMVPGEPPCPGIDDLFPAASRMQRAVTDLSGVCFTAADTRPWLSHAAWPPDFHPLSDAPPVADSVAPVTAPYEFVRVEGDGVHEIAVGPVHAGTIEPGHFRFSVVGEKVLRLEARLGYVHKGIEQRFTQLPILEGHRLAARVSGDSAVAFSWAYCQALEGIAATQLPPRAAWLRALYLEQERVANHLGDLGALGNDAGFAFGLAQFSRLKEQLLRMNQEVFGERYLLGAVVPGGTRLDLTPSGAVLLHETLTELDCEVLRLRTIYDEHAGVRDRFSGAGTVDAKLARRLGLDGLPGRASGQSYDLRVDLPCEPYGQLSPMKIVRAEGDVAARVALRFDELRESFRLMHRLLTELPDGSHQCAVRVPPETAVGAGLIEGWRGPVWVLLEAGHAGTIRRCHPHDPSWNNWPALEYAVMDNIVPDFPLINKSFNLSYSGHDL